MKHPLNIRILPKTIILALLIASIIIPTFIVNAIKDTPNSTSTTVKVMPVPFNNTYLHNHVLFQSKQTQLFSSSLTHKANHVATFNTTTPVRDLTNSIINGKENEIIQPTNSLESPAVTKKRIALTFDDGPHPVVTARILKTLSKYNAKATFFVIGKNAKSYPETVKATFEQGHEIGNHTYLHKKLTSLSTTQILQEYKKTNWIVFKTIGQNPTVFRPPYGDKNARVTSTIPMPMTMWTIDTRDWQHKDAKKIVSNTKKSLHNNAIILMHDIHLSTADGLDQLLSYLQKEDYEFVTVSELQK